MQTAADISTRHSLSPSSVAAASSAPVVASSAPVAASSAPAVEQYPPHSLLPSASAAAGGRLCSAGSRQLCCLRRPE